MASYRRGWVFPVDMILLLTEAIIIYTRLSCTVRVRDAFTQVGLSPNEP